MAAELTDEQIITTALSMGMWGVQGIRPNGETFITSMGDGVIKTVRALLATQGAEPVAEVIARTKLENESRHLTPRIVPLRMDLCVGTKLYTAPPPKAKCTCVYATAKNTPAVRQGYEMGGYVKSSAGCPVHDTAPPPTAEVPEPFLQICREELERSGLTSIPLKAEFAKRRGWALSEVEPWMIQTRRNFEKAVAALQSEAQAGKGE